MYAIRSYYALATYLGLDPREQITLREEELDVTREYDLDAATALALEVNPWLKASEKNLEAWEAAVRVV